MSKKNKHNSNIPQTDEYGQFESIPPGGCDDAESYRDIGDVPSEPTVIGDPPKDKSKRKNAR